MAGFIDEDGKPKYGKERLEAMELEEEAYEIWGEVGDSGPLEFWPWRGL